MEAGATLNVTGGAYDSQLGITQAVGDANFNLGGTLLNTGGSIFAGHNVAIAAGAVVNDQTAPSGARTTTTAVTNPNVLWSGTVGQVDINYQVYTGGDTGELLAESDAITATLGGLLSPTGSQTAVGVSGALGACDEDCGLAAGQPVSGSGVVYFNEYQVTTGPDGQTRNLWYVGASSDPHALATATFTVPTIYETATIQQPGKSGVISARNAISLAANSLSNKGGQIAAQGNVSLSIQSLDNGAVAPMIRQRKGKKDRMIPIGDRALA